MNRLQWSQKFLCFMLILAITIAGCGPHGANPHPGFPRYLLEKLSCSRLEANMAEVDGAIAEKEESKDRRDKWNLFQCVSGFFFIVPWFYMDLHRDLEVEIAALKASRNQLQDVYHEKKCAETTNQSTN